MIFKDTHSFNDQSRDRSSKELWNLVQRLSSDMTFWTAGRCVTLFSRYARARMCYAYAIEDRVGTHYINDLLPHASLATGNIGTHYIDDLLPHSSLATGNIYGQVYHDISIEPSILAMSNESMTGYL